MLDCSLVSRDKEWCSEKLWCCILPHNKVLVCPKSAVVICKSMHYVQLHRPYHPHEASLNLWSSVVFLPQYPTKKVRSNCLNQHKFNQIQQFSRVNLWIKLLKIALRSKKTSAVSRASHLLLLWDSWPRRVMAELSCQQMGVSITGVPT